MKKTLLCLTVFSALLVPACRKESCIRGVVTDAKTGEPVSGAYVHLHYEYQEMGSLKYADVSAKTNQNGEFSYTTPHSTGFSVRDVLKARYSPVFTIETKFREGDCSEVEIKVPPLDGTLNLKITNETGTYDSLYAGIFSKCLYREYFYGGMIVTQPFPLTLKKGETYVKSFGCCVGDSSAVQWRFTQNDPWFRIDSFLVETSDTLLFEIKH